VATTTPEELQRALAASERRVAELQAWADASDAEAEQLRARVAELEAAPPPAPPPSTGALAASERRVAELQAWADASDAEAEQLRARVAELEAAPAPSPAAVPSSAGQAAELQAWLDASEAEVEQLKARVAELEAAPPPTAHATPGQAAELQVWLDASEAEIEKLKGQLAESNPAEATYLRERVAELETAVHSLTELNRRFSDQVEAGARRDVSRLTAELEAVKERGNPEKLEELQSTLENAREAIATLESERLQAVAQVQRYASNDSQAAAAQKKKAQGQLDALTQEKDARIAVLQSSLGQREGELKTLEGRLMAYHGAEQTQKAELERLRIAECEAREQLAHVRSEREVLQEKASKLAHQVEDLSHKLAESKAWLESSQAENDGLEKQLESARLEGVVRATEAADADVSPSPAPARASAPATLTPVAAPEEGTEGFSLTRLRRLESLLSSEKTRTETLQHFLQVAEKSLATSRDALELAQGRLADLARRLSLSEADLAEVLAPLVDGLHEVQALDRELAQTLHRELPPPPPLDAFDEAPEEVDVVSAPMGALEQLTEEQAAAARQAGAALQGEQKAREALLGDLDWLKHELDKLSSVRDELRTRLGAMVTRELKRKAVVASLLDRLRATEATTAARAGALKRLQAAIELAQRTAVKVQTIYFQKQVGSLTRQLDAALGKKKPAPRAPAPVKA
jgi:chromosome segregation ATPase